MNILKVESNENKNLIWDWVHNRIFNSNARCISANENQTNSLENLWYRISCYGFGSVIWMSLLPMTSTKYVKTYSSHYNIVKNQTLVTFSEFNSIF